MRRLHVGEDRRNALSLIAPYVECNSRNTSGRVSERSSAISPGPNEAGQVVTFEIAGGKPAAFRFLNALELIKLSNNLGDAKSLITHPATTTHQRLKPEARAELGISDGMLRLSIGLETPSDLAADIDRALAASKIG